MYSTRQAPSKNPNKNSPQQQKPCKMPFSLIPVQAVQKKKKKSLMSQKIKQRRKKNQQEYQLNQSQSQNIGGERTKQQIKYRRPKNITQPSNTFDQINYISLQQFQGLVQDERTLQVYKKAIKANEHLIVNKIVLHLTSGCNMFYSIYAAQVGAAKVYCVVNGHNLSEQQNIWMMKQIIKQNGFQNVIQVLSFKDFNAEVDIIIGEPMGYCMHYDGMLDRIIEARDLFLDKRNGIIMPNKLYFKCAFINDQHFYDKKVQFWNQIYGIPMRTMSNWISHQPIVKIVDPTLIVSDIKKFIQFDLNTISYQQVSQISRQFEVKVFDKTQSNGLTIWFEIQFDCQGQKIQLKNSPWQDHTKFTHVTLYSSQKYNFKSYSTAKVKMYGKRYPHHGVSVMKVNIQGIENVYTFS